jgi:hypothetical protein
MDARVAAGRVIQAAPGSGLAAFISLAKGAHLDFLAL